MSEKRKPIPASNPDQYPCPLCGSDDYEFGSTYQQVTTYIPESSGMFKSMMSMGKNNLKVRVCRNCGHLMFLVDERQ